MDIVESFNGILNDIISHLPEDKQKHCVISKGLFGAMTNDLNNQSTILLHVLMQIYTIGLYKELKDKNIESNESLEKMGQITKLLKEVDEYITDNKLDTEDLNADLLGALSATMLNHFMYYDIKN